MRPRPNRMRKRRPKPQSRSSLLPITFNQTVIRTYITHGVEHTRKRFTARNFAQASDPQLLGEVLLRGIKEGV